MPDQRTAAKGTAKFLTAGVLAATPLGAAPSVEDLDYFETKIRPLLIEHCYECHSAEAKKLKANLYLDTRAGWQTGGDSGPALVPGNPDESLLVEAVTHEGDLEMPPKYRLTDEEVAALRKWIEMGAPDPRTGEVNRPRRGIDLEKGREFWSFQTPTNQPVPAVKDESWPAGDIDRFILAKLEEHHLAPAGDAPRRSLLRRIHYDLTGLPPTPDEIRAFLADDSAGAIEKVVDDLLARPEFGERWGQHWLDVARFAESSGGGRSLVFPDAWRFRDYVIDSFNEDKPYDAFIREQLAGDVLDHDSMAQRNEQLVGSGYLVIGPINYELQDHELLEMEFVDEQIDALGRTFLGMTLGCARCHDHKFDPIPTTDYYALAGIFQSTRSMGEGAAANGVSSLSRVKLAVPDGGKGDELRKEMDEVMKRISKARARLKKTPEGSFAPEDLPGAIIDATGAKVTGNWTSSTSKSPWVGVDYLHDEDQPKGHNQVEFNAVLPAGGRYEVRVAYSPGTNRATNTPVTISHAQGDSTVLIDQTKAPTVSHCFVNVGTYSFSPDKAARVTISNKNTNGVVIADAVSFLALSDARDVESPVMSREKTKAEIKTLEKELSGILADIKKYEPRTMAPSESEAPADGHVHIRGQVRNKGEKVPRGFLTVATKPGEKAMIAPHSSGRLELAHWIASADNPLTARVMANRIWRQLLGEGIVRTPDNFGLTGELPSHPELLDHLAREFVAGGWSSKSLIRKIVLSRTYRLSSDHITTADPENRLFGRAHRKRLEAECIRDTALMVSGQLDHTRGGPTIGKIGQYDLGYKFDTTRRSIYVPRFRNSILDIFEVFDAANPNLVVGRRTTTNLPTQALFLMNSAFIREQSELTARRLLNDEAKLDRAYELILGRPPTDAERTSSASFLATFAADEQEEAWTQLCQTLLSCLDFRFLD